MTCDNSARTTILVRHPTIVVGVPVYNEVVHITECLASLRSQTWTDFAVLISDNASTDDTEGAATATIGDDRRFLYHRQVKNLGAVANFNFLRDATESPYFMWLGAHDAITPTFLEEHLSAIMADKSISLSYSFAKVVNSKGEVLRIVGDERLSTLPDYPVARYILSLQYVPRCTEINCVIRRSAMIGSRMEATYGSDRVILSHIGFFGRFNCVRNAFYIAREAHAVDDVALMKRLVGDGGPRLDRRLMIDLYLSDFDSLMSGSPMRTIYRWILRSLVAHRFVPEAGGAGLMILRVLAGTKRAVQKRLGSRRMLLFRIRQ